MRHVTQIVRLLALCGAVLALGTSAPAQPLNSTQSRVVAVPIEVVGAQLRSTPGAYMQKLTGLDEFKGLNSVEVLDLAVAARAADVNALAPSLDVRVFIGRNHFPIQRVEYSNWDMAKERPLGPGPVGEFKTFHIFVPKWRLLRQDQPIVLTALQPAEYLSTLKNDFAPERIWPRLPGSNPKIPRYRPLEFLKLNPTP